MKEVSDFLLDCDDDVTRVAALCEVVLKDVFHQIHHDDVIAGAKGGWFARHFR